MKRCVEQEYHNLEARKTGRPLCAYGVGEEASYVRKVVKRTGKGEYKEL